MCLNQIPNILTVLRVLLILPFALFVLGAQYDMALVVFFIAGLSDGIDGFLARQFNWQSRFGAIADPLADKLLLMTAYIVLAWTLQIPLWLTVVILSRDLVIVLGALIYHYFISHYDIKPSIWGKACTMAQIIYALAVIVKLADYPMPQWVVDDGMWLVLLITVASGLHYILTWSQKGLRVLASKK